MSIQTGEREKLLELWGQVDRLVWKMARRWAQWGGIEAEDLVQEGFIAFLRAVESYDPQAGAVFSTYLTLLLKGQFIQAAGLKRHDPLRDALSLDAPLPGSDEGDPVALADVLEDPQAVGRFQTAECRQAVEKALHTLPADQQAAIRGQYYLGLPVDNKALTAALRALRHPRASKALRGLLE